ncbi:AraC family transcriptional regulator [Leptolyngbya sp. NK1-12]|uniref:AraC family transcriptional regulator n=1 Tax=Leptolyngbya sp. NK1-12 TaxID=2547451 RepID=A0AA96WG91_9CYAN|nr:AraC family transcriptional regulator [Leptolyngbya sp. NK1-12]WNZ24050.1 AraC family transcriptional regulator [Leptolyngbya sp. NK1-12]
MVNPRGQSLAASTFPSPQAAAPKETVKFWRNPDLGDIELLKATYVTHSFSRHTHDSYAIGVIDAGVEEFTYRGATHRATANSLVIVHPGEVHTGHAGVPSGWQYRMFYPGVELLQQTYAELTDAVLTDGQQTIPYFPNPVIQDAELAGQLRRLHHALETASSRLECDSRFVWTFAQLIARHAERRCWIRSIRQENQAVQQVLRYLKSHYAEAISLDDLAKIANLKPLRLLRLFQREVGLPPHAYLVQLRVKQAKQLIGAGVPIAQAAFDTGFTDQSHLNRHFKRLMGVTPGQYALGCGAC